MTYNISNVLGYDFEYYHVFHIDKYFTVKERSSKSQKFILQYFLNSKTKHMISTLVPHTAFRLFLLTRFITAGPNLVLLNLGGLGTVRVLRLGSCGVMIWGMWWEVIACCSLSESISSTFTAGWMLNLELAARGTTVTVTHCNENQSWVVQSWFVCDGFTAMITVITSSLQYSYH